MKTFNLVAVMSVWFSMVISIEAENIPLGPTRFEALRAVQGRPGRVVKLQAQLWGDFRDTTTHTRISQPLPNQSIGFYVDDATTPGNSVKPVGRIVNTDASGRAGVKYRIPRIQRRYSNATYSAKFQGDTTDLGQQFWPTRAVGPLRIN